MKYHKQRAIVFDVDGTLTKHKSWDEITLGLKASLEQHHQFYYAYIKGDLSHEETRLGILKLWQDSGNATLHNIKSIVSAIPLKSEVVELCHNLKQRDYIICLISGAVDTYISQIAELIKADCYFTNGKLKFDPSGHLSDFVHYDNEAEHKLTQFKQFLKEYSLRPEECIMVGDGDNDLELFKVTGISILVSNKNNLHLNDRVTHKIENLSDILKILDELA